MQCKHSPDAPGAPNGPDGFRAPGRRTLSPNALFFFADVRSEAVSQTHSGSSRRQKREGVRIEREELTGFAIENKS